MSEIKNPNPDIKKNRPVREPDMSLPDPQEVYDNNISQYETHAPELEKSQDEELQEDMKNNGGGR